jgi:Glycine-zipper domain
MRTMNRWITLGIGCLALGALAQAPAPAPAPATAPQPAAAPAAPGPTQDAAASLLKVYVFPANNQTPDQQAKDSNDCYAWAKQQTGVDPTNPTVPQKADTSQAGKGSAVRGAAKGAAAGAAIGAIAGDTGKGAAIGATAGGMGGVAGKKASKQQAEAQAKQQQQAAVNQQMDAFKKAYTACMEGKKYTVK